MTIEPRAVSIEDCAACLGLSQDSVRGLIERHELQAIHVGRRVIVPLVALDEWIDRQLQGSETDPWAHEQQAAAEKTARARSTGVARNGSRKRLSLIPKGDSRG